MLIKIKSSFMVILSLLLVSLFNTADSQETDNSTSSSSVAVPVQISTAETQPDVSAELDETNLKEEEPQEKKEKEDEEKIELPESLLLPEDRSRSYISAIYDEVGDLSSLDTRTRDSLQSFPTRPPVATGIKFRGAVFSDWTDNSTKATSEDKYVNDASVSPSVGFLADYVTKKGYSSLNYGVSFREYVDEEKSKPITSHSARTRSGWKFNRRLKANLQSRTTYDNATKKLYSTQSIDSEYAVSRRFSVAAKYSNTFNHYFLEQDEEKTYCDNRFSPILNWHLSERSTIIASYEYGMVDYFEDDFNDSYSHYIWVGLNRIVSRKTKINLKTGFVDRYYKSRKTHISMIPLRATISHQLSQKTSLSLIVSKRINEAPTTTRGYVKNLSIQGSLNHRPNRNYSLTFFAYFLKDDKPKGHTCGGGITYSYVYNQNMLIFGEGKSNFRYNKSSSNILDNTIYLGLSFTS